jgi:hypothetical protein
VVTSGVSLIAALRVRDKAERIFLDAEPGLRQEPQKSIGPVLLWVREQHSQFPMRGKASGILYARFRMRLVNDGDTRLPF